VSFSATAITNILFW